MKIVFILVSMSKFVVSTDSTCDFTADEIKSTGIFVAPLEFTLQRGEDIEICHDNFTETQQYVDFYNRLRAGEIARTTILSVQAHVDLFTTLAKQGITDVLHIAQGYGLSPTVDNANAAIKIVKAQYPQINYVAVEANTTTVGEGIIVRAAIDLRDAGVTLAAAVAKINSIKAYTQHFVLVNDLKYLVRGGRISKAAATVGSVLQVKPIIEFDRDGKLKVCRKEIGLKKALRSIVDDYGKFTLSQEFPYVFIVHTDNEPLAKELQTMLYAKYGITAPIKIMGPIVGAHIGPGAVAYGFLSNEPRPYA